MVARPDIDAVFVATSHDLLAPISAAAASAGKHVLVEKPAARRASELNPLKAAAHQTGVRVQIGFNHRYHRAFQKAREISTPEIWALPCSFARATVTADVPATIVSGALFRSTRAVVKRSIKAVI